MLPETTRSGHPGHVVRPGGRGDDMPKVLTEAQIQTFQRDGCLSPVRAMSAERASVRDAGVTVISTRRSGEFSITS